MVPNAAPSVELDHGHVLKAVARALKSGSRPTLCMPPVWM